MNVGSGGVKLVVVFWGMARTGVDEVVELPANGEEFKLTTSSQGEGWECGRVSHREKGFEVLILLC